MIELPYFSINIVKWVMKTDYVGYIFCRYQPIKCNSSPETWLFSFDFLYLLQPTIDI